MTDHPLAASRAEMPEFGSLVVTVTLSGAAVDFAADPTKRAFIESVKHAFERAAQEYVYKMQMDHPEKFDALARSCLREHIMAEIARSANIADRVEWATRDIVAEEARVAFKRSVTISIDRSAP